MWSGTETCSSQIWWTDSTAGSTTGTQITIPIDSVWTSNVSYAPSESEEPEARSPASPPPAVVLRFPRSPDRRPADCRRFVPTRRAQARGNGSVNFRRAS